MSTSTAQPASDRHERGLVAFAALMNHWLGSSGFSHQQLESIADWGLGEEGFIDKTMVSRLKNRRQPSGPSWRHVDAIAAANEAIWLWQTQGHEAAQAKLGPPSSYGITAQCLDDATWLAAPEDPSQPLRIGQLAALITGHLELPYLVTAALSPSDAKRASDRLAEILNKAIVDCGWGAADGIQFMIEAYPSGDKARQRRLKRLILRDTKLNREELEAEIIAMAEMLRVVRGLTPESYGAAELRAELAADHLPVS